MNRRDLIFSDLRPEDSGSVGLNCRTDVVRDAISLTPASAYSILIFKAVVSFFQHDLNVRSLLRKLADILSGARSSTE